MRLIILTSVVALLSLSQWGDYKMSIKPGTGLFSWSVSSIFEEPELLFHTMRMLEIDTLYQEFSTDTQLEAILGFLEQAQKQNVDVYYLAGTPEWGIDKEAKKMLAYIDHIIKLNQSVPKEVKLKGIVLDVEPYLTDDWDENQEIVMSQYVSAMQKAYQRARENDLEVIICIPYFYDTKGYEKQLEELIRDSCDMVAVMNYYKEKEEDHITKEMELAHLYNKGIIQIYELKKPGTHDLTDKSTYYHEGIDALLESFRELQSFANYNKFNFALHDYKALKEVIESE